MVSTMIICVILAAACVGAVISYRKKVKNGCCGSGEAEIRVRPKDKNVSHYAHKTLVYLDGMTCGGCAVRIENAFNEKEGCYAKVNLRQQCAELWSKEVLSEDEIRRTVQSKGYTFVKAVPM